MKPTQAVLAALSLAACAAAHAQAAPPAAADATGWREISTVLRHPRCMNCHTVTEFPRQGDDRHRHQQLVMRGPANHGAPTLQCSSCHQSANSRDGKIPGAPNWALAPLAMGWETLADAELCRAVKDPARNGQRDLAALVHHMTEDALVQWAWAPGARVLPPVSQTTFHAAVRQWAASKGPCP